MAINLTPGSLGGDFGSILAQKDLFGADLLFRGLDSIGQLGRQLQQDRQTKEAPQRAAEQFTLLAEAGREAEKQRLIGLGMSEEQASQQILTESRVQLERFMAQNELLQAQAAGVTGREERAGALAPLTERTAAAGATTAEIGAVRAGEEIGSEAQLLRSLARQLDITKIGESLDPETRAALLKVQDLERGRRGAEAETGIIQAKERGRVTPELTGLGVRGERARVGALESQAQMQKVRTEFFEEMEEARLLKLGDEGALLTTQIRIADQQLKQNEQIFAERLKQLQRSPDPRVVKSAELFVAAAGPEGRRIDTSIRAAVNKVKGIVDAFEAAKTPEAQEAFREALATANTELSTAMGEKNTFLDQALLQIERITSGTAAVPTGGGTPDVREGLDRLGR